jgi:hypothetical protein
MTLNKWTLALAAAGVVSLGSIAQAEEAQHSVLTALSSTTLSGYVDTSAIWRAGTRGGALPGRSFDNGEYFGHSGRQNGFNLHVVNLKLEKPLDEGHWSAGYKVDLLFGPDAAYYRTIPLAGNLDSDDFNVKQAYAAFRIPAGNGIDVKMGVFDTVIGYEVFESPNNPNFSRSYGFFLEPTHHTGVLASYHLTDLISLSAGVAETAFGAINERAVRGTLPASETQKTYMGSLTITLPEAAGVFAGSSLYAGVVDGLGGLGSGNTRRTTSLYAGTTLATPVTGLAAGAAFDYRRNGANPIAGPENWAWAAALYTSYQATEQIRFNLRGEVTRGSAGTYHLGAPYYVSGDNDELFALTATIDYSLWAGLITRLEARWDRSFGGDDIAPYASRTWNRENGVTLALNMVYKF